MTTDALRPPARNNALSNEVLGTSLAVLAEITMFTGLIAGLIILRSQFTNWPPLGQPRLPIEVTALNSLVLFGSGFAVGGAVDAMKRGERDGVLPRLRQALTLASLFLLVQGYEWARLIGYGLTAVSHVYGALFYTIVGAHALHVAAALLFLTLVQRRFTREPAPNDAAVLNALGVYWLFVVGIWPMIYVMVYLW